MKPKVLVVAAEASSALYMKRLLEYWKRHGKEVDAFGVGSKDMEELGFDCLGYSHEMAVVGLQEVISHYSLIKNVFKKLIVEAANRLPNVALLLDFPGFNLRLAAKLKKLGIPIVYYISPQIWAWHQNRVKKIRAVVNKMLVVFPFEKDFYDKHGMDCSLVGHPLLDELDDRLFDPSILARERRKFGITENDMLLALMPGSRHSEVNHHLKVQLKTAEILKKQNTHLKVALLVAPTLDKKKIQEHMPSINFPLIMIQKDPMDMVKLADLALVASGTATLVAGLLEKPMVIMYKMNALTAYIARKVVHNVPHFGIINLVLGSKVCPEFFQENAVPPKLSEALKGLIHSPEQREAMREKLQLAKTKLGDKGATRRVAEQLEPYIGT